MTCKRNAFALSLISAILLLLTSPAATAKTPKLEVRHLTGDFYIYTTYNLYQGTPVPANGMFVLTAQGAVLFDTPWDTTQTVPLLNYIRTRHGKEVVLCISTHSHDDRTGGTGQLNRRSIPTYTTVMTDSICALNGKPRATNLMRNDTTFAIGTLRFSTLYPGRGHAPDNIVIWFPDAQVLYGGCFIKSTEDTGLGYLGDADVPQWETSMLKVMSSCKNPAYVIPGHGSWKNRRSMEHTLQMIRDYKQAKK